MYVTLHQLGDSRDFVTLPAAPSAAAARFLEQIGLRLSEVAKTRPSHALGVAALESALGMGVPKKRSQ